MSLSAENRETARRALGWMVNAKASAGREVSLTLGELDRLLNAARSVPLSVGVEEVVEALKPVSAMFEEYMRDESADQIRINSLIEIAGPKAQAILSKLGREEDCSSGGRVPASPDGLTEGPLSAGWERTDTAPYACCVLASRFDRDVGEWVYGVVMSPPSYPFTHWMPLPEAPAENSAGQPSEASASARATDEPLPTPPDNP